ncbi:MAG: AAA+ family ATPase [Pseudomonadota bacterium]
MERHLIAISLAAFLHLPATAAEEPAPESAPLLPNEEDLRQFGELAERWMRDFSDTMAPMAQRLRELVDDLDAYEAPEILPNGDNILPRKRDEPDEPAADGDVVDL